MRLAISNIAWEASQDTAVYGLLGEFGFDGVEIAPTRIFANSPYDDLVVAAAWASELCFRHRLCVASMQSVWFGRSEKLFGEEFEREILLDYTKKAVDFASAVRCENIVFGSPKNRNKPNGADENVAVEFFKNIGDYAFSKNVRIAMEANPQIYGTNFLNTTEQTAAFVRRVDSKGIWLNLDLGTMVFGGENERVVAQNTDIISHVHISEPHLKPVKKRALHEEVFAVLREKGYDKFVSVEMAKVSELGEIKRVLEYVKGLR